jgi:hypothetical protein
VTLREASWDVRARAQGSRDSPAPTNRGRAVDERARRPRPCPTRIRVASSSVTEPTWKSSGRSETTNRLTRSRASRDRASRSTAQGCREECLRVQALRMRSSNDARRVVVVGGADHQHGGDPVDDARVDERAVRSQPATMSAPEVALSRCAPGRWRPSSRSLE